MNIPTIRAYLYAILFIIISVPSICQNRYVSPTGDDAGGANNCSNSGTPCLTIAHAITQSIANDIVHLAAGNYNENITINVDITLSGANAGMAASGSRGGESIINPLSSDTTILITASGVTIDGIQIGSSNISSNATTGILDDGNNNLTISNSIIYANSIGVNVRNISSSTVTVNDNHVEMLDLEDQTNAGTGSIGILLANLTGTANVELSNNDMQGASWGIFGFNLNNSGDPTSIEGGSYTSCTKGIEIDNADGTGNYEPSIVNISRVTMSGFTGPDADVTFPDAQAGIYAFVSGSASASDDVIIAADSVNISGVGNAGSDYSAVYVAGFAAGGSGIDLDVTVTNSNISDNLNRGIYVRGGTASCTISQCVISGNGFDPNGPSSPGFSVLTRTGATTTISNCIITNALTQIDHTTLGLQASASATMTVTDCSMTNNGNGFVADGVGGSTLDLSRNWFGSISESAIIALISTPTVVDFTPWIGSGTDTDGGTAGFQPDLGTLYVSTSGAQTGATGRWQEGHDLVNTAGTVILTFANYDESVTVTKNLTFQPTSSGGSDTSLDSLIINGTGVTMNLTNDLLIDSVITVTLGAINISSGELRLGTSAADISESTSDVIDGTVSIDPRPVGTGSIDLLGVSIAAGAADDLGNVTITRNSGTSAVVSQGANSSISVTWNITVDTQPINSGRNVSFTWLSDFDNGKDVSNVSVFRNQGSGWEVVSGSIDASGSDPRTVTVNAVTGFSDWTVAQADQPLPVELSSFQGHHYEGHYQLLWSTLSEVNSDYFEVQKSLDGEHYSRVAVVKAAGNSSKKQNYEWRDYNYLSTDISYYRLKIVDIDGSTEYSKVIVLSSFGNSKINVYPNPASHYVSIDGDIDSSGSYSFYNQVGHLMLSGHINEGKIDVSILKEGVYILVIEGRRRQAYNVLILD